MPLTLDEQYGLAERISKILGKEVTTLTGALFVETVEELVSKFESITLASQKEVTPNVDITTSPAIAPTETTTTATTTPTDATRSEPTSTGSTDATTTATESK